MQTENIVKYLQTAYGDEKLAALLAHAQDNKLGYGSCCCFIGIATADHALQEAHGFIDTANISHYGRAKLNFWPMSIDAEQEFKFSGRNDAERREAIIPLIQAEMARRDSLRHSPEFMEIIEAICK